MEEKMALLSAYLILLLVAAPLATITTLTPVALAVALPVAAGVNEKQAQYWAKTYRGSYYDESYLVRQTTDRDYIVGKFQHLWYW